MRGLCRLTAALLSLACASTTFVIPSDDAVDRLQDPLQDTSHPDQAPPLHPDHAGLELETLDLSHANLAAHNVPADDDNEDGILMQHWRTWLDTLETDQPSPTSASLLSDIPTSTLAAAFDVLVDTTESIGSVFPSTPTYLSSPPEPTSLDWFLRRHTQQQPLADWSDAWRAAKYRVQSVVALVASHITDCPSKATKTASAPSAPSTPASSTITARTLQHVATNTPEPAIDSNDGLPLQDGEHAPLAASIIPTAHQTQPTPAHFTGSSYVSATSTPSSSAAAESAKLAAPANASNQPPMPALPTTADVTYIAAVAIPVVLTVILSCIIFSILIRRNPRRRAEHAARCEERKNLRLYRRAACRHKMETLASQIGAYPPFKWFAQNTVADLAEKGLLENTPQQAPTSNTPNSRVSQEIASFREAHVFVDSLIHAEEGGSWSSRDRRRTYMWLFGGRARRQRTMSNASSDISDSEKTAPPPYDERSNYEKVEPLIHARRVQIVDREDAQDSDKSSVSSVIPTSPLHSTFTFSTGDPDSDKE